MRIVGGDMRGRRLMGPTDDGGRARLRPTSDRMREAVFNILAHGDYPPFDGAQVLDLFAGTGAMGIEALSRGAERAVFVDDGREARALLKQNIDTLDLADRTRVIPGDALRFASTNSDPFDMIFCDAPYAKGLTHPVLNALAASTSLTRGTVIIVETATDELLDLPSGLALSMERRYGAGKIHLLRVAEGSRRDT